MRKYLPVAVLIIGSVLVSCNSKIPEQASLRTPLLLWHAWNERDTSVLNNLLAKFSAVYPDVDIIQRRLPEQDFVPELLASSRLGLGPDVVIAHSRYVRQFVDAGVIQPVSEQNLDLTLYFSTALKTLRYNNRLYGIPLSLHTQALYYNTSLVKEPPNTLQQLLEQASGGTPVALDTGFYEAIWGIQAFGGQIFAEDGRIVLDQGGFANWLGWLKKAQNMPGILLNTDQKTLYSLFLQGRVAYYAASSEVLQELQAALGENVIGAVPLPAGPNNPSGPALESEAFMLNANASAKHAALAVQLVQFFSTFEQQTELIRQTQRVPANSRVWVDPRIYPAVSGFAAQSRTAIALPNIPQIDDVRHGGNDAYIQTLAGVLEPQAAAQRLTDRINAAYGFERSPQPAQSACDLRGTITVWFLPQELNSAAMETIRATFQAHCPKVVIQLHSLDLAETEIDVDSQVYDLYHKALVKGIGPDILIGSNHLTALLAAENVLLPLDALVEPEFLQRYLPEALQAVTSDGKLYALPFSIMELMALYYNADLVVDPPLSLDDLLNQADAGHRVLMPINFYYAYWGLPVFGARLFDEEYRVTLDGGGFEAWLTWLRQAQEHPNMRMISTDDTLELQHAFANGEVAYLAGEVRQLSALQAALGTERLRVIPLPAGSKGRSGPILGIQGGMVNAAAPDARRQVALAFVRYLADIESQTVLMEQANQVPANVNVDTTAYPAIGGFLEQARTASVPPIVPEVENVFYWGNDAYTNVLDHGIAPAAAVRSFVNVANKANGFRLPISPPICPGIDTLRLWHSWIPPFSAALDTLITRFVEACPDVTVTSEVVPESEVRQRLVAADQHGDAPDLLLTSHMQLNALKAANLLKPITPLVNDDMTLRYRFGTLGALEIDKALYGLPLDCRVSALFYRSDLVDAVPMLTLDDLLTLAASDTPVALDSRFLASFWGISAFGDIVFGEDGQPAFTEASFAGWLNWLQQARQHDGMIFSDNDAELLRLFTTGKAPYLITDSAVLASIRTSLEADQVGVAYLPSGPHGDLPMPLLRVNAFVFPTGGIDEHTRAALDFAVFATSDAAQTDLMHDVYAIPVNQLSVVAIDDPGLAVLSELVDSSIVLPGTEEITRLESIGNRVYTDLLSGALRADDAVSALEHALEQGTDVSPMRGGK